MTKKPWFSRVGLLLGLNNLVTLLVFFVWIFLVTPASYLDEHLFLRLIAVTILLSAAWRISADYGLINYGLIAVFLGAFFAAQFAFSFLLEKGFYVCVVASIAAALLFGIIVALVCRFFAFGLRFCGQISGISVSLVMIGLMLAFTSNPFVTSVEGLPLVSLFDAFDKGALDTLNEGLGILVKYLLISGIVLGVLALVINWVYAAFSVKGTVRRAIRTERDFAEYFGFELKENATGVMVLAGVIAAFAGFLYFI